MRWPALTLTLAASVCIAAPRCPDPRLRQATIGGDTITGFVVLHKKPLEFATVQLYSSSGKTLWTGTTDKSGRFTTSKLPPGDYRLFTTIKLPPGDYRLEVSGWGSTTVKLNPELDKGFGGQIPVWNLSLLDDACVGTGVILD